LSAFQENLFLSSGKTVCTDHSPPQDSMKHYRAVVWSLSSIMNSCPRSYYNFRGLADSDIGWRIGL